MSVPRWDFDGPGDFEPLVSQDVFDRVQLQSSTNADGAPRRRRRDHPDFPLRRFIRCNYCSAPLTGSWSRGRTHRYAYYRCPRKGCGKVNVGKDDLEQLFASKLSGLSARSEAFDLLAAVARDAVSERNRRVEATRRGLEQRLEALDRRTNRLVDAFVHDRSIDQATYDSQLARLQNERSEAQRELHASGQDLVSYDETLQRAALIMSDVSGCWHRLSWEQKPKFQAALFPEGLTYGDEGIGTDENSWLFSEFAATSGRRDDLAARTGFEPVPPP